MSDTRAKQITRSAFRLSPYILVLAMMVTLFIVEPMAAIVWVGVSAVVVGLIYLASWAWSE